MRRLWPQCAGAGCARRPACAGGGRARRWRRLIAGTGSITYGWAGGHEARAGGWGHLLGDEGSSYWVVREGVRRVLADDNAERPPGPMVRAVLDPTGSRDAVELMYTFHERDAPAGMLAGAVLAAAPDRAVTAGRELAALGTRVADG